MSEQTLTVSRLFAFGDRFIIPDYQRPYSWDREKIVKFFKKIIKHSEHEGKPFPIGRIVICPHLSGEDSVSKQIREFHIVDGEQRVATVTIMLSALRDIISELCENGSIQRSAAGRELIALRNCIGDGAYFKLMMDGINRDFFFNYIQSADHSFPPSNASDERIFAAYAWLRKNIEKYAEKENGSEFIIRLIWTLVKKIRVSVECIEESYAHTYFEKMNAGKRSMMPAVLLKNHLYSRFKDDEIRLNWSEMCSKLEDVGIQDPSILIRYAWNSVNPITSFGKLYDSVTVRYASDDEGLRQFFRYVFECSDILVFMMAPSDQDRIFGIRSIEHLRALAGMGYSVFSPLIFSLVKKNCCDTDMERVLGCIERLSVRNHDSGGMPNSYEQIYSELALQYHEGTVDIDGICKRIESKMS